VAEEQAPREPTEDELRDAIAGLKISDLLAQTLVSVSSLCFAKLEPGSRDLDQARIAIEALRALGPVLEGTVDADLLRDLEGARASLQLAYAKAVDEDRAEDADSAGDADG
jgi:hypothetical protein